MRKRYSAAEADDVFRELLWLGEWVTGGRIRVEDAAIHLGISCTRMERMLKWGGYPSAGKCLRWGRIIQALRLYSRGASLDEAAAKTGWPSQPTLSRAVIREYGRPASALRRAGDLDASYCGFDLLWARHREAT